MAVTLGQSRGGSGGGSGAWASLTGDLSESQVIPFDGSSVGTPDTGISRLGPSSLAIGNGTAGDVSGQVTLGELSVSGAGISPVTGGNAFPTQIYIKSPNAGSWQNLITMQGLNDPSTTFGTVSYEPTADIGGSTFLTANSRLSVTLTSVTTSTGGVAVYPGTIPNGANGGLVGYIFTVSGFSAHPSNNGSFVATASSALALTLANTAAIAEVAAATAFTDAETTLGAYAAPYGAILAQLGSPTFLGGAGFQVVSFDGKSTGFILPGDAVHLQANIFFEQNSLSLGGCSFNTGSTGSTLGDISLSCGQGTTPSGRFLNIRLGAVAIGTGSALLDFSGNISANLSYTFPLLSGTVALLNNPAGTVLGFNSDTGISRLGAASLAIGNGTTGSTAGNLSFNRTSKAGTDFAGQATVTAGNTTQAVAFAANYTGTGQPIVVLTPTSDPLALGVPVGYWVTYSGGAGAWTGFTVNVQTALAGNVTFNYIVIGVA